MLGVKVIASAVLLILGTAASIWGFERLSARFAWRRFWIAGLLFATIGALPELFISLMANAQGLGLIAFGTPLGSSAINMLLLAGLAATISPTKPYEHFPSRSLWGVACAVLLLMATAYAGRWQSALNTFFIARWGGALLLVAFAAIIFLANRQSSAQNASALNAPQPNINILLPCLALAAGIALVAGGAALAASAALAHIVAYGSSQYAIGILGLALLAALPEATVVIFLAKRKLTADAFSDLSHSSTTNLLLIIGISALAAPIPAYRELPADLGIVLLGALLVQAAIAWGKGKRVNRCEGIALIAFYLLFATLVLLRQNSYANVIF